MNTTAFRKIPKGDTRGRIPLELEERIRQEAYRDKLSCSAVLTKYLARGMGYRPEDFGLVPLHPNS